MTTRRALYLVCDDCGVFLANWRGVVYTPGRDELAIRAREQHWWVSDDPEMPAFCPDCKLREES